MWFQDKWQSYQASRAQRYLARHPDLGIAVLRRDHDLATQAVQAFYDMQAKAGAPQREGLQFPYYMGMSYGGRTPVTRTLPKPSPWNLRAFSQYPPSRRAINVLSNPILELPYAITLRRPAGLSVHDAPPEPTADQQARMVAAMEMFAQPNEEQDGREFLEMLLEDLVVLGASPFEVAKNRSDTRPLFLWPIDAQSIRINMQWAPGRDTFRYSQGKGLLFGSLGGAGDEVKFADQDLCYPRLNPRTSTPFGLGYMEVAYESVNSFIGAFQFATRRASNETPAFGLFLGENFTPEQTRMFRHYWENEVEGAGKIPIIGGGRQPTAFTFSAGNARDPLWIAWQEHIIRCIAMAFGIAPMRLGLERDVNRNTAQQGATDDWGTAAPVAEVLRTCFTHWVLGKRLGWRDLEFQWQVKSSDELRQAQILSLQYAMNGITVDEIRQIYKRPPLPEGLGDMTRSPYEAAVKAASMPQPLQPGMDEQTEEPEDESTPETAPPHKPRLTAMSPFLDYDDEDLSPGERAFMREVLPYLASTNGHAPLPA